MKVEAVPSARGYTVNRALVIWAVPGTNLPFNIIL